VGAGAGRDPAGTAFAVPSGDGTGAQLAHVPSSLPPVASKGESAPADLPNNAQVLAPRPQDERERFKGELPPEPKSAAEEAIAQQIEEFIPNLWKASRAAVQALAPKADEAVPADTAQAPGLAPGLASSGGVPAGKELPYPQAHGAGKPPATPGDLLNVEA